MRLRRGAVSPTVVTLAAVSVAAATAVALVLTLPVDAPQSLTTATLSTEVAARQRQDADERQVQLVLESGAPRAVVTTRTGIVTALRCTTGGPLRSGDVVATVDGAPVIAIATGVPLWRDLVRGTRGDDVRALQAELARLGSNVTVDGLVGTGTLRAALSFLTQHGVASADVPTDAIPVGAFSWIPAAETTVRSCSAVVGASVPADGVLVVLPAELRSARLERVPVDPVAGARRLTVGTVTLDIGGSGVVTDPSGLRSIEALGEYQATVASADGAPTMVATWSLAAPIDVDVVPPSALWDVTDGGACVQPVHGAPRRVSLIGSELGQAFVRDPSGERLDRVRTQPDRERPCR